MREENYNLVPQFGPHCGEVGGEKWKCVEWAEMNEKGVGYLKSDIVSDFKFRSKCMFGAELRKEPIERA